MRPAKDEVQAEPQRPPNVKQQIVVQKGPEDRRLLREDAAMVFYRPTARVRSYRPVVLRTTIAVERHLSRLSPGRTP